MKKIAITLSDEDFSMLEVLCEHKSNQRTKSQEIAWLIKREVERLQEHDRELAREQELMKTPTGLIEAMKSVQSRIEKAAGYVAPSYDTKIIQFPAGQFLGSA